MPEIVIPGIRDVGNGPSEARHQELKELREQHRIQLWSHQGTEEECEDSWRQFLLAGTPDWEIWS
jgi:hypothetical protein